MLVDVVPIRHAGRRLKGRELGPAVRADLAVRASGEDGPPEWRHTLRARLRVNADCVAPKMPELIDVRLLSLVGGVIRLIGIELRDEPTDDQPIGSLVERIQIWRCHVVPPVNGPFQYQVVRLRQGGRRLRRQDLAPPVPGELCVVPGEGPASSYRREGLSAKLYTTRGANSVRVGALLPIFDARLLDLHGDRMILAGIELDSTFAKEQVEWAVTESVQVWCCTLLQPARGELPVNSATEQLRAPISPSTDEPRASEGIQPEPVLAEGL